MKVEPKTEQQVQEDGLLVAAIYDFEVIGAEDTTSKSGNDMAIAKLLIVDNEGKSHKITDYLVAIESMAYKIRHFADSIGLLPLYEKGDLPASMMIGRTGRCKIIITPAKDGYRAKNTVSDYVKSSEVVKTAGKPATAHDLDDEIPF